VELLTPLDLYLAKSSNLSDLSDIALAKTNLGLGTTDTPTFSGLSITNYIDFAAIPDPSFTEGRIFYDVNHKTISYYNDLLNGDVDLGQESLVRVYNNTGVEILAGQAVYISGIFNDFPTVSLALANDEDTAESLGITTESIPNGSYGYVTNFGLINNLNTAMFASGDEVYLSNTVSGGITAVRPAQPSYQVRIGYVIKSDATNGVILVTGVSHPVIGDYPSGALSFGGIDGFLNSDDANFFWDNSNKRLGIGTNLPSYSLDVRGDIKAGNGSLIIFGSTIDPDPVGVNGSMYYNLTSNKFRCFENSVWVDCIQNDTMSLNGAYGNGASITTASAIPIHFDLASGDFNVDGAGAVNLTPTSASSFTSGGALTLTGGQASTWGTTSGNLNLQVADTSTGNVQIGTGGAGSTTPDLLVLDTKSDAGDPFGLNGSMYYNSNSNKFRCYESSAWKDCDIGGGFSDPMTTSGDIIYRDVLNSTTRLSAGAENQVLTIVSGIPSWATLSSGFSDPMITSGDIIYRNSSNITDRLPVGQSGQVLESDGTNIFWGTLSGASVSSVFGRTGIITADPTDYTTLTALTNLSGIGNLNITAGAASVWSTSSGALTLDSASGLNLGTTNATGVNIGKTLGTFALTSTGLNVSIGGALTGVASLDTISTSATDLTFAGIGTIDSGGTSALNIGTGAAAKTITIGNETGATNVNILAGTGNITLGTSNATGTLLVLDTKTGAGDPAGSNGSMYYNSNSNKFRCFENSAWKDCDTAGTQTLQTAYNGGSSILATSSIALSSTSTNDLLTLTKSGTGNALTISNTSSGYDILGSGSTWSISKTGILSTSGNLVTTGAGSITSAGILTAQNGLTMATGALNLTATSGALTLSGLSASSVTTSAGSAFSLTTGTIGVLTLDSGTTGAINIGTGANAKIITIGNTTGATALNLSSGTGNIKLTGKILTAGGTPTQTQSSGTATVATGSTDFAGKVTSSTTSHTYVGITFSSAFANAPFCTFSPGDTDAGDLIYDYSTGVYVTTSTTYMRIYHSASTKSSVWNYYCIGH